MTARLTGSAREPGADDCTSSLSRAIRGHIESVRQWRWRLDAARRKAEISGALASSKPELCKTPCYRNGRGSLRALAAMRSARKPTMGAATWSAERLKNGNTLIAGAKLVREVNPAGSAV